MEVNFEAIGMLLVIIFLAFVLGYALGYQKSQTNSLGRSIKWQELKIKHLYTILQVLDIGSNTYLVIEGDADEHLFVFVGFVKIKIKPEDQITVFKEFSNQWKSMLYWYRDRYNPEVIQQSPM